MRQTEFYNHSKADRPSSHIVHIKLNNANAYCFKCINIKKENNVIMYSAHCYSGIL